MCVDYFFFRGRGLDFLYNRNKTMKLEDFITTPEIMKAIIPNPRFLLLLRDPVTRLWSDYM